MKKFEDRNLREKIQGWLFILVVVLPVMTIGVWLPAVLMYLYLRGECPLGDVIGWSVITMPITFFLVRDTYIKMTGDVERELTMSGTVIER